MIRSPDQMGKVQTLPALGSYPFRDLIGPLFLCATGGTPYPPYLCVHELYRALAALVVNNGVFNIETSWNLAPGTYIVLVSENGKRISSKILVNSNNR